jgi:hypothetical protein
MPDTDAMLQAIVGGGLVVGVAKLAEVWWRRRVPAAEARRIDVEGEVQLSDAGTRAAESLRATLTAEITSMAARHTLVVNGLEMRIQRLEESLAARDARIRDLERENDALTRRVVEMEQRLTADERKIGEGK